MEKPAAVFGVRGRVRDAKTAIIKKIRPITLEDVVLGQYGADPAGKEVGYTEDPTVPEGSQTPTFACVVLYIDDERWRRVVRHAGGQGPRPAQGRGAHPAQAAAGHR